MDLVNTVVSRISDLASNISVAPTYIQAGAIIFLLFLLVVSLAQFRQHFVKWSMKGGLVGLFFGVLLTLILEGFLLLSGHTAITGVLGWKTAPKPISTALDLGKEKLTNVLGVGTDNPTSNDVITIMQSLPPSEISKIKAIICTP
jgi:hypothetical protein